MKIMWVIRPAEGGILQHLQQLSEGISDLEIVVVAPPRSAGVGRKTAVRAFKPHGRPAAQAGFGGRSKPEADLEARKAHIVHAHGLKAALITASALFFGRGGSVFFVHRAQQPAGTVSPLGHWAAGPVQRWLFQGMDTIISVSDSVRMQILKYAPGGDKVMTIHNGILPSSFGLISREDSRAQAGLLPEDLVVGTVARLIPDKGIATLLEAVSLIAKILPDLKLVIVGGDGPERHRLEGYAQGLGLGQRAIFLGQREDVPCLMAGWNCLLCPV